MEKTGIKQASGCPKLSHPAFIDLDTPSFPNNPSASTSSTPPVRTMKSTTIAVGLLAASQQAAAVVDKWTPEDYDWNSHTGRYGCATTNVSARPMTKEFASFASESHNLTEDRVVVHQAFAIPITIGVVLRGATWLGSAVGVVSTGLGCYEVIKDAAGGEQVSDESKTSCITGAAAGLIGFGGEIRLRLQRALLDC